MKEDWYYIQNKYAIAGIRDWFESACKRIVEKYTGIPTYIITANPGDEGIDFYSGMIIEEPIVVYQCKFFLEPIKDSQKAQIKSSFDKALNSKYFTMKKWILCFPGDMDIKVKTWWDNWKKDKENETGIKIEFLDGYMLIDWAKDAGIYEEIFEKEEKQLLREIHDKVVKNEKNDKIKIQPSKPIAIYFILDLSKYLTRTINNLPEEYKISPEDITQFIFNLNLKSELLTNSDKQDKYKNIQILPIAYGKKSLLSLLSKKKNTLNTSENLFFKANEYRLSDFPNIEELHTNWNLYKKIASGNGIEFLSGNGEIIPAFQKIEEYPTKINNQVLVIISTGKLEENQNINEIETIIRNLKTLGIIIITIYIGHSTEIQIERLYNQPDIETWPKEAILLFNIATSIKESDFLQENIIRFFREEEIQYHEDAKLFFSFSSPIIKDKILELIIGN